MKSLSALFWVLALIIAAPAAIQAGTIPVTNFSFESPALGDGSFTAGGTVSGWTLNSANEGVFNPMDAQYAGTTGSPGTLPPPADGMQVFYDNSGDIVSDHSLATLQANDTYTLTVALGNRLDSPQADGGTYLLELLANGSTVLASKSGTDAPSPGTFADYSVSATTPVDVAHDPDHVLGGSLTVLLQWTSPGQISFDNVRLSDNPVPEPSSLALVGMGLAGVAFVARRRRTSARRRSPLS